MNWKHKEIWTRHGDRFAVEVSRHTAPADAGFDGFDGFDVHAGRGPNRWCVYAYIYPDHPHFGAFEGDGMFQPAAGALPLHGGPTYLRWHYSGGGGTVDSVQVGADYDHLNDYPYTHYATPEAAGAVFADADRLFDWLTGATLPEGGEL